MPYCKIDRLHVYGLLARSEVQANNGATVQPCTKARVQPCAAAATLTEEGRAHPAFAAWCFDAALDPCGRISAPLTSCNRARLQNRMGARGAMKTVAITINKGGAG